MIGKLRGKAALAVKVPPGCSIVMFDGSIRSSKTISSLLLWARFVRSAPKGNLAMIARTERAVIDNLVTPLQEMFGAKRVVLNRGLGIVSMFGRTIQIYGANDAQAVTKIQGLTLAGAYVDEGTNIPEAFFNMLRSRLSVAGAMLYLTCNPDGPRHWLKTDWLDKAEWHLDKNGELHHYTEPDAQPIWRVTFLLSDNLHLIEANPVFVQQLMNAWPKGSMFYRRYILSEWVSADGAVYPEWNEETMTVLAASMPPVERILMASVDYGTTHRTRGYLLGMTRVNVSQLDGKADWAGTKGGINHASFRWVLVVLSEFAPETATVGQHALMFDNWLDAAILRWRGRPEWIAVDPAAATFKAELFARGHSDVMNAHNRVLPGIQTVSSLFSTGRLYVVADECPELVKSIPGYMWSTKATERGATEVVKENDDEVDALRYDVFTSRSLWRDQIPLAPITSDESEEPDE